MIEIKVESLPGLRQAAQRFLKECNHYRRIAFSGEMGAGKTTFIQALAHELGVEQTVNSPTFALVNEYFTSSGESVYHIDLYRIEEVSELFDMGYEDYFFSGKWCFIEWPEKAAELIPDDTLCVRIEVEEDQSRLIRSISCDSIEKQT